MVVSQTTSITPSTHAERHKPDGVDPFTSEILQSFVDDQSFTNLIENGNFESWSGGTNVAPDGWTNGGLSAIAKETTIVKIDSASIKLTPDASTDNLYQTINDSTRYLNKPMTFGCWVYCSEIGDAYLNLRDSGGSNNITNTLANTWEWLAVTRTIDSGATWVQVRLYPDNIGGTTLAYFDGAMLVEGSICPTFNPKPQPAITALNEYDTGKHTGIILDDTASGNHDTSAGSYTLLVEKSLSIDADMNISLGVTFTLSEVDNNGTSFGKIHRNGVAVGTERQVNGAAADLTTSEVIAGWSDGDLLQIYGYQNNGHPCRVFDLKVYGGGVIIPYPTWA